MDDGYSAGGGRVKQAGDAFQEALCKSNDLIYSRGSFPISNKAYLYALVLNLQQSNTRACVHKRAHGGVCGCVCFRHSSPIKVRGLDYLQARDGDCGSGADK
jgi:hypothetical protein